MKGLCLDSGEFIPADELNAKWLPRKATEEEMSNVQTEALKPCSVNTTELKKLAEAATPGPWFVVGQPWNPKADFIVAGNEDPHIGQYVADTEDFDGEGRNVQENAAYIAAANPAAILELLAINAELVGALKEITADYADRFDLEDPSTNPGIKSSIALARASLAKVEGGEL